PSSTDLERGQPVAASEDVHPDVCGGETITCPFSYVAVVDDAPHVQLGCAPPEAAQHASTKGAAAAPASFRRSRPITSASALTTPLGAVAIPSGREKL